MSLWRVTDQFEMLPQEELIHKPQDLELINACAPIWSRAWRTLFPVLEDERSYELSYLNKEEKNQLCHTLARQMRHLADRNRAHVSPDTHRSVLATAQKIEEFHHPEKGPRAFARRIQAMARPRKTPHDPNQTYNYIVKFKPMNGPSFDEQISLTSDDGEPSAEEILAKTREILQTPMEYGDALEVFMVTD